MTQPQPNGGFEWTQEPWGAALRCAPLAPFAEHLFTTGNLRLVDDQREWEALARRMQVERDHLRLIRQVHGTAVAIGHAGVAPAAERPQADLIISADPDVAIAVRVADCAAVLVADRRLGVVGAAHAGWRGTVQSAASRLVGALKQTFASNPEDLLAAIGPCLGPCCGEVGPEVVEAFRAAGHHARDLERWFTTGASDRPYLNLWTANRDQLHHAGVPPSRIHVAEVCTKSYPERFHSYRAQGRQAGRMAAVIRARRP